MHGRELTARRRLYLVLGLLTLVGLSAWRLAEAPPPVLPEALRGAAFGTTWTVRVGAAELRHDPAVTRAETQGVLGRIDREMSTYREDSEVRAIGRQPLGLALRVSAQTFSVLQLARRISVETGGAFDVTVAPLVRAFGFGARASRGAPPSGPSLDALRARVGYRGLSLQGAESAVVRQVAGLEVDLSAIAKGYAVDEIAATLDRLGLRNYMVEVGGEIRVRGERLPGEAWRLAIEAPDAPGRRVHRLLRLRDMAMATSGDYRSFIEHEGGRYSHTIDPRAGGPIKTRVASATVLRPSAAEADALATAMGVLGITEGLKLARQKSWAVYLLERCDSGLCSHSSPAFERLLDGGE